jgi:hypothetical protein
VHAVGACHDFVWAATGALAQCSDSFEARALTLPPNADAVHWGKRECFGQAVHASIEHRHPLDVPVGLVILRPRVWEASVWNFDSLPNAIVTLFMVLNQAGLSELLRAVSSVTGEGLQPRPAARVSSSLLILPMMLPISALLCRG